MDRETKRIIRTLTTGMNMLADRIKVLEEDKILSTKKCTELCYKINPQEQWLNDQD